MADKWEWDVFEIINRKRAEYHIQPLTWCCALENEVRGSCGGTTFILPPLKCRIVYKRCEHWTPPSVIAYLLIQCHNLLQHSYLLNPKHKSGIVIISNDALYSYIRYSSGTHEAITWEELNNYPKRIFNPLSAGDTGFLLLKDRHPELLVPSNQRERFIGEDNKTHWRLK